MPQIDIHDPNYVSGLDNCVLIAVEKGYKYAAMMNGDCMATNKTIDSFQEATCDNPCPDGNGEMCGTSWVLYNSYINGMIIKGV